MSSGSTNYITVKYGETFYVHLTTLIPVVVNINRFLKEWPLIAMRSSGSSRGILTVTCEAERYLTITDGTNWTENNIQSIRGGRCYLCNFAWTSMQRPDHRFCIKSYEHSCLKLFLNGPETCSNNKTQVQIMKFMCCLNMDSELSISQDGLALFTLRWAM